MLIKKLVVGPIQANCYIVGDEASKKGIIIDPGDEGDRIMKEVEKLGLNIEFIIATHGHFDHCAGVARIKDKIPDVPFIIHEDDLSFVKDSKNSAMRWGMVIDQVPDPDRFMKVGEEIEVGDITFTVLHTPGHSQGCISLLCGEGIFVGDTLFEGSIGRTDFEGGSLDELKKSIKEKLYTLPDDTVVFTGHGAETTIGVEKKFNMFVRG
ncbi:MAG: MBL fold metallo-hydrolase [Candidatus Thermoplasmatota archaeon]|jgi:glyoxylase-like metal-dependent hydrolase (beta-lactamase superfamily II)|nr:MBL fold metallo-hydrolase [Candidatus Thermoplasmatota archaeon]MDP7264680.1 MBL fold metallo-hydrolase [Candidatus Thermoplasmatota archaeon]